MAWPVRVPARLAGLSWFCFGWLGGPGVLGSGVCFSRPLFLSGPLSHPSLRLRARRPFACAKLVRASLREESRHAGDGFPGSYPSLIPRVAKAPPVEEECRKVAPR